MLAHGETARSRAATARRRATTARKQSLLLHGLTAYGMSLRDYGTQAGLATARPDGLLHEPAALRQTINYKLINSMRNFKTYKVWQDSMQLVTLVYQVIGLLPREERYALADQLRRSVVSIPSNIAEGAGRKSTADFQHFLNIAIGSAYEVETQLIIASQLGLVEEKETAAALEATHNIERQLIVFTDALEEGSAPRRRGRHLGRNG